MESECFAFDVTSFFVSFSFFNQVLLDYFFYLNFDVTSFLLTTFCLLQNVPFDCSFTNTFVHSVVPKDEWVLGKFFISKLKFSLTYPFLLFISSDGNTKRDKLRPEQKPLELMNNFVQLLRNPSHKRIIFDPFVGTGTTALAAIKQGFSFIGSDSDHAVLHVVS